MVCDPPMYGRMLAGTSSTMATHQPAETITAPSAASRCQTRRRPVTGRRDQVDAGERGQDEERLQLLGQEAEADHRAGPEHPAQLAALDAAQREVRRRGVSSSTSSASGLLNRNISAATGVSASTPPASSAVRAEKCAPHGARRRRATVATPISASGSRMLNELSPNRRTDSAMIHRLAGGLSTVIELRGIRGPVEEGLPVD